MFYTFVQHRRRVRSPADERTRDLSWGNDCSRNAEMMRSLELSKSEWKIKREMLLERFESAVPVHQVHFQLFFVFFKKQSSVNLFCQWSDKTCLYHKKKSLNTSNEEISCWELLNSLSSLTWIMLRNRLDAALFTSVELTSEKHLRAVWVLELLF